MAIIPPANAFFRVTYFLSFSVSDWDTEGEAMAGRSALKPKGYALKYALSLSPVSDWAVALYSSPSLMLPPLEDRV